MPRLGLLVCLGLLLGIVSEAPAQVVKPRPPPGLNTVTAGRSGITPVRKRRRKCAPENRAQCHGQEVSPIVLSGMAADLVLGQPDLTSSAVLPEGTTARSLAAPMRVGSDAAGTVLLVSDTQNNRVLVFAPVPTASFAPATRVLGQTSFTEVVARPVDSGFTSPLGVTVAGTKIIVADLQNYAVTVHTGGTRPALVLGKGGQNACAAGMFAGPFGVWSDGTRLVVADAMGNRVLVWRTFPTTNGQPADLVLGQPDMTNCSIGNGPNQMSAPESVTSDGTDLYVADGANNRVLVFRSFMTKANGAAADLVLGKAGPTAADTMIGPRAVLVHDGALFVGDFGNARVLVWDKLPTTSGQPASHVLGRPTLTSGGPNGGISATTMGSPMGLAVTGDKLWVADFTAHRVLRYSLYP